MGMEANAKNKALSDLELLESSQALKQSMSFVIGKGLPLPTSWSSEELDKLVFPSDITMLASDKLGELMGLWTTVMSYVEFEVAKADIERTGKENKYEFERRKKYIEYCTSEEGKAMSEEFKKSCLLVDDDLKELQIKAEHAKAKYLLIRALLKGYAKYFTALSRELSRREVSAEGRAEPDVRVDKARARSVFKMMQDETDGSMADEMDDEG